MTDVSVVLPVYRTGAVFAELCERISTALETRAMRFEIIAVDDGCPDGSAAEMQRLATVDSRVRVLCHTHNRGQQHAAFTGICQAVGDVVVVMDADLQDAPEDIGALLDALAAHQVHAVFAGRRGVYQSRGRMLTSRVFKRILSALLGVPRDAGSFVALSRTMVVAIASYGGRHPYLLSLVGGTGLPVSSIPVERSHRPVGRSAYSSMRRARFAARALITALSVRGGRLSR